MTRIFLSGFMLIALLSTSCKKDKQGIAADATIIDGGDPASDGCGWELVLDSEPKVVYKADNLTTPYQINNLKVSIRYTTTSAKYTRGFPLNPPSQGYTVLHLTSITKK